MSSYHVCGACGADCTRHHATGHPCWGAVTIVDSWFDDNGNEFIQHACEGHHDDIVSEGEYKDSGEPYTAYQISGTKTPYHATEKHCEYMSGDQECYGVVCRYDEYFSDCFGPQYRYLCRGHRECRDKRLPKYGYAYWTSNDTFKHLYIEKTR